METNNLHQSLNENFREFYDSVGRLYPEEHLVYKTLRGLLRRQFVFSYLRQFQGLLLDLGCNRGYYISKYTHGKAIGVDISYPVLQQAKKRLPDHTFLLGDGQRLGFLKSNSMDAILCSEVIEHVPDAQSMISECFRILKAPGSILVTTPNYKRKKPAWISIGEMKAYGVQGVRGDTYFHTAFRPEELRELAEAAGFHNIEVGTFEKEVKYATRLPVLFFHIVNILNKNLIHSKRLARVNETLLNKSSLLIYRICNSLGLNKLLTSLVKEGVRSYLVARKEP